MILKFGEEVLTLLDKPTENDAFSYFIAYDEIVKIILNIERNSGVNNSFNN